MSSINVGGKFVVTAANILDKGVAEADHPYRTELCETAHRPEPGCQPAMISFDGIVCVSLHDVAR